MDRLNHVKLVTPDPRAVEAFLTEVLDVPAGWGLGEVPPAPAEVVGPARAPDDTLTMESISAWQGTVHADGVIVGSPESRQFQVFRADEPKLWAVAIGTRNVEQAHDRCVERGLPCTDIRATPWGQDGGGVTFFFVEVGGLLFEVLRVEAAAPA